MSDSSGIPAELKEFYLDELPSRCDTIEKCLLAINNKNIFITVFSDLYRHVHSLKGSAGTFGFSVISDICHRLEDHLITIKSDYRKADKKFVDDALMFVDLIREVILAQQEGVSNFTCIENKLKLMAPEPVTEKLSILLVESSSVMAMMIENILGDMPVELTIVDDGLKGLEMLIQHKYDFLVFSRGINSLNGVALMSALRESEGINKNVKSLMLYSGDAINIPNYAMPNYLVKKDQKMAEKLKDHVSRMLNSEFMEKVDLNMDNEKSAA